MTIAQYIDSINQRYKLGNATEHTFRGDLQQLIESIVPNIRATNEPKRQSCGAPDYILTKKDIPVGFIEAKDIGNTDLDGQRKAGNKEQFDRYKASLDNLIFTDYINFHLYHEGEFITKIAIAEITEKGIKALPENFEGFENLIKNFCSHIGQTIKSSKKLAKMMAGKARLLSDIIGKALTSDEVNEEDSTLKDQKTAFKQILIHDITPQGFADVYAQTIAYGMFAARLHDPTLDTFSRQEAAELIPKSNPFLRKLFGYIAGPDIDDRIKWVVDSLTDIFMACNVEKILKNYGKSTKMEDPIIHFYETFLSEYDPKLRKSRGVWYTPQPVVNFIVRAVDDILKTEFDLPQGLADTSQTTIKVNTQTVDKRSPTGYKQIDQPVHKVQILDPATGTGTFLAEVIKHIYKKFEGQQGIWSNYVETHLLPRLNGFELLMASYAMAHLKFDLLLKETGYKPTTNPRFRIYLTNSLEESHPDTGTLFASWLSTEANEANRIKRNTPVMCVIGNPPYSGISSNNGEWISNLIEDYKYVDGVHFNERKHWLNDDYVKFIRYGQHFIEKNGSGVLAFINPHGFLDNPTFRGMRWILLKTYDKIYTIDLHGNSNKKETTPDGKKDENVFDIKQGVSINIFVKTGKKKSNELGKVFQYDIHGKRDAKYNFLWESKISNINWRSINISKSNYAFKETNLVFKLAYDKGFKLSELFNTWTTGVQTSRDKIALSFNKNEAKNKIIDFCNKDLSTEEIRVKYFTQTSPKYPAGDTRDWKLNENRQNSNFEDLNSKLKNYLFRPFDNRKIIFHDNILSWSRYDVSKHLFQDNLSLITARSNKKGVDHFFISKSPSDVKCGERTTGSIFCPLYLYPETTAQQTIEPTTERTPNLNPEIVKQIAEKLGLTFTNEKISPTPPKEGLSQPGYVTANPVNYKLIKEMRDNLKDNPTEAEKVMWEYLRNKKTGYKIRRQHIIDNFITDFVCLSKKVVIEIDGKIHLQQKEYDELRTERLSELGYEVIRYTNEEVFDNPELVVLKIKEKLDSKIDPQNEEDTNSPPLEGLGKVFAPIDILDYIYAVLHSPTYREKYKEFLKIDFPRVPYPKNQDTFWQLVKLGGQIRQIHLLESPVVEQYITQYPADGDNMVDKPKYEHGKVYINKTQYFDNVPQVAWEFYIGGYQPAQKWLKDRKSRNLEFDDILHYQKIIVALYETHRLMKQIDSIEIE